MNSENIYVGAFLIVKNKDKSVTTEIRKCEICIKEFGNDINFCPKCGTKINIETKVNIQKIKYTGYHEDHFLDRLYTGQYPYSNNEIYLFPNEFGKFKIPLATDSRDGVVLWTEDISIKKLISEFGEEYSDILQDIITKGFTYEVVVGSVATVI